MQNSFNSNNELWTEMVLSGGWIEVLAGADSLSQGTQDELNAIKIFGVANSYIKYRHVNQFLKALKEYFQMEPGTTD